MQFERSQMGMDRQVRKEPLVHLFMQIEYWLTENFEMTRGKLKPIFTLDCGTGYK